MNELDALQHNGVKGMHWGQRKENTTGSTKKVKPGPELMLTKKFSTGDSVSIYKNPSPFLGRQLAKLSPAIKENLSKGAVFSLKDKDGVDVGQASFFRKSEKELSLDWVHVKTKHRGKGYASAALQGVVKYAQDQGIEKLTLEVPGNAPDARHIYEKLGFKNDPSRDAEMALVADDPTWGGLTAMSLDVKSVAHSEAEDEAWERQYSDEFAQLLSDNFKSNGEIIQHSETNEFFTHNGVKGMHWGKTTAGSASGHASTRKEKQLARGEKKLFKEESTGDANFLIGTKVVGTLFGAGSSAVTFHTLGKVLGKNNKTLKGLKIASGVLQGAAALKTIRDISDIHAYDKSRKEGTP